jgi:hypothetical protein
MKRIILILGIISMLLVTACGGGNFTVTSDPLPIGNAKEQFIVENSALCEDGPGDAFGLTLEESNTFCQEKGFEKSLGSECLLSKMTVNCV